VAHVKSQELAYLCVDTIGEVSDAATDGLHRIASDAALCFAFLRHRYATMILHRRLLRGPLFNC
jgi:hypothetical protein